MRMVFGWLARAPPVVSWLMVVGLSTHPVSRRIAATTRIAIRFAGPRREARCAHWFRIRPVLSNAFPLVRIPILLDANKTVVQTAALVKANGHPTFMEQRM